MRHSREVLHVGIVVTALSLGGCLQHDVDLAPTHHTVKIEPIYMTVNINLRVQQELDEFYSDIVDGAPAGAEQGEEL